MRQKIFNKDKPQLDFKKNINNNIKNNVYIIYFFDIKAGFIKLLVSYFFKFIFDKI
jgi:hypothetical protein